MIYKLLIISQESVTYMRFLYINHARCKILSKSGYIGCVSLEHAMP